MCLAKVNSLAKGSSGSDPLSELFVRHASEVEDNPAEGDRSIKRRPVKRPSDISDLTQCSILVS